MQSSSCKTDTGGATENPSTINPEEMSPEAMRMLVRSRGKVADLQVYIDGIGWMYMGNSKDLEDGWINPDKRYRVFPRARTAPGETDVAAGGPD